MNPIYSDEIHKLFPANTRLNSHVRYIERSAKELNISDLNIIRDQAQFERNYTLGAEIGKGGFGKVSAALDNRTNASVVIKEVDSDRVPCWCRVDGVMVPMEVILLKKLPRINGLSSMLEVYELNGAWEIVMAGNSGSAVQDLFDYICKRGYLSEAESAFILYQLIGILMQCHHAGVIHRDLKDENILINLNTLEIRLIDFGSGALLYDGLYRDFDGTRVYSPPEWLQTGTYDGRSAEVWTIGILLFDMINGDIPFMTDQGILAGTVRFRRSIISQDARMLIHSCLNQSAQERPTLMQILMHPWMQTHRNYVAEKDCQASRFALSEIARFMGASPLSPSITVRTGLCNLPNKIPSLRQATCSNQNLSEASSNHATSTDSSSTSSAQECGISPDLLPVQSAESVSASFHHLLHQHQHQHHHHHHHHPRPETSQQQQQQQQHHQQQQSFGSSLHACVYSGYLKKPAPKPSQSQQPEEAPLLQTFHPAAANLNPVASGLLHPLDTRHPINNVEDFFRLHEARRQFSLDFERDFLLNEDVNLSVNAGGNAGSGDNNTNSSIINTPPSPSSSGYFTRCNSMDEEINRVTSGGLGIRLPEAVASIKRSASILIESRRASFGGWSVSGGPPRPQPSPVVSSSPSWEVLIARATRKLEGHATITISEADSDEDGDGDGEDVSGDNRKLNYSMGSR